jgi:glutathione S-transferase
MSDLPILYSFRRCPYAMRARLALAVSGIAHEIREVSLRQKPAEMVALSPKATVPVLLLPDGTVIEQSLDIMHWALQQHDPEGWLEGDTLPVIAHFDGAFKYHLDRYKYPNRYNSDAPLHRAAAYDMLVLLDITLVAQENLARRQRSLVDMAIMPFIRQYAHTDAMWFAAQPVPKLQHWLSSHQQSPLFLQIMAQGGDVTSTSMSQKERPAPQ